jgi:translation initiation factor IF-2
LSKLRVTDMASEFGIPSEEVINLLRSMDVPVRSHMSSLTDDQVARVRARWEREKRARAEKPAAASSPARRRRTAAPTAEPAAPAAEATAPVVRRRRKAAPTPDPVEEKVEEQPEAEAAVESKPEKEVRRRPAVERPEPEAPIERPAAAESTATEEKKQAETARPTPPPQQERPQSTSTTPPAGITPAASASPSTQRPRSIVPGTPRPRPVASSSTFLPPRPVASAAPGGATTSRRDERKGGGAPAGGGGAGGGGGGGGGSAGGRRGRKGKRGAVDQQEVSDNISKVMTSLRGAPSRRGGGSRRFDATSREEAEAQRAADAERERKTVRVNEFITVSELGDTLKVPATQIVAFAFKNLGLMVTINQRLDFDQIELIASEFGFQAVREEEYQAEAAEDTVADTPEDLEPRPPVVTIMGHVDHGKTSLLDYIRKANVVAGESGGITQHIGAYHVTLPGDGNRTITFLDTPGHEAFTAMRARGAQVTDIVILVVAADDGIMPQTIEAISHAKNAGVPIIVAINKIDLAAANPSRVKQELLSHGVVLEEFGGQVLSKEVSAKQGTGIQDLLETLLLQAEILDLKANPNRKAQGTVVEAQLDPGKGPVATILVQNGTLKVGDDFIVGMHAGRVRALLDERGKSVKEAGPAVPVQVLGLTGVPMAGDQLIVVEDATHARDIAQRRERLEREARSRRQSKSLVSLEDFMSQAASGEKLTLKLIIKADQGGPAEALADALQQLSTNEVQVEVIQRGVGAITESDILLARTSGAIIIGFHVRPDQKARSAADREGVDIKLYRIIYEAVSDVRAALEGMLRPEEREVVLGEAEVREVFKISRVGTIAGCSVRNGTINRQARIRVVRNGVEVYDGTISSLKRFKDDVKEVREGFECGIGVENFNDIKVGDVLECYRTEEVARTLEGAGASAQ